MREANQMVEEMMLLANVTVAEHVLSRFAGCTLLRRHGVPPPRQFEPLLKAASAAGFSVDISSSKVSATGSCDLVCCLLNCVGLADSPKRCHCQGRAPPNSASCGKDSAYCHAVLTCKCVLVHFHRAHVPRFMM